MATFFYLSSKSLLSPFPAFSSLSRFPLHRNSLVSHFTTASARTRMVFASSQPSPALPPLPENRTVLGCGLVGLDFLATVSSFPNPDSKIRSTSLMVEGGGNAGNALTCAARLGLTPKLISKVADDPEGKAALEELEAEGVDTSFFVVSKDGNSPFSYVIVDSQTKTRTVVHTPGYPPMKPDDIPPSSLTRAMQGTKVVYLDGILDEAALVVAGEANRLSIPVLVDAELFARDRLDDLLNLSDYVVCSTRFPQVWTRAPSMASALISMLLRLPNVKFVIVTLGADGCIMLERSLADVRPTEEIDVDWVLELLKQKINNEIALPTCIPSKVSKLKTKGGGSVCGRLLVGTAEKIPPSELVDTTGAGDAFIGAVLYGICANMPPEKMIPFAAQVAAVSCRAIGARAGLPHRDDPRLAYFLQ